VWYRNYEKAMVLVNARKTPITITLPKKKFIDTNDKVLTTITIPAEDGVILMRK
jgi:hypothetical protein